MFVDATRDQSQLDGGKIDPSTEATYVANEQEQTVAHELNGVTTDTSGLAGDDTVVPINAGDWGTKGGNNWKWHRPAVGFPEDAHSGVTSNAGSLV